MIYIVSLLIISLMFYFLKKKNYSYNKEYKRCESPIEEMLMNKLHTEGYKPYTQVNCGKYRIDIALYQKGKKIAIECDGHEFHSTDEQLEHDEKKNKFLEKNKWMIYRFSGKEIYHQPDWCVKVIKART